MKMKKGRRLISMLMLLIVMVGVPATSVHAADVNRIGQGKVATISQAYTGGNSQVYANLITKADGTKVRYVYSKNFLNQAGSDGGEDSFAALKSVLTADYAALIPDSADASRNGSVGFFFCSDPSLEKYVNENWTSAEYVAKNFLTVKKEGTTNTYKSEKGVAVNTSATAARQNNWFDFIKSLAEEGNKAKWEAIEKEKKAAWDAAEAKKHEADPTYNPQEYKQSEYVPLDFGELTGDDIQGKKDMSDSQIDLAVGCSINTSYEFKGGKLIEVYNITIIDQVATIYSEHAIISESSSDDKKEISRTITFKIVNGFWDDGNTKDQIITIKGYEGDTFKLKANQIPVVGSKPGSGYKKGSWDVIPNTSKAIIKDVTYTYTYAKVETAKVTKAPTARKLTYNGKRQALVNSGTASDGKMYYAVTTNTTAPKANAYKTSIPKGKDVGTYYVWYKAKGKTGYKDSDVKKVKVTIAKKTAAIYGFNTSFKCTQTKGKAVISWTKQSNVAKVDAYVTYCGTKYPTIPITTKKNAVTITKINGKKLDQTRVFKIHLVGYDNSGKKVAKTITAHFVGKNSKNYTNVKSFTLNKSEVTIKKGKSTTLRKATIKLENTKKKQISDSHAAEIRYHSTNPKVAKVDKNGKITGVAEGSCTVYAYARNGLSRKVKVTVTKN